VNATAKASRTGRLTVNGRINRAARGKVTITYRAKIRGKWRTKTTRAEIRRGRYHALMKLPAGWKHARGAKITVRYAGSATVKPQTRAIALR
jgi:hypothetical protein